MFGSQYSAGIAGENRGVITNSKVNLNNGLFNRSKYVAAGVAGFNLGGLIKDVSVDQAYIIKDGYSQTAGGIVGRNVYGTVADVFFNGELSAFFTGGIVGANYTNSTLLEIYAGTGALSIECKNNNKLMPSKMIKYKYANENIENLSNVSISKTTFNYLINDNDEFYSYKVPSDKDLILDDISLKDVTEKNKVIGLIVGLTYEANIVRTTEDINSQSVYQLYFDEVNSRIVFNGQQTSLVLSQDLKDYSLQANANNEIFCGKLEDVNTLNYTEITSSVTEVMYLIGAVTDVFDSFMYYSDYYIFINPKDAVRPTI